MTADILSFPARPASSISDPLARIRVGTEYEQQDIKDAAAFMVNPDKSGLVYFWIRSASVALVAAISQVLHDDRIKLKTTDQVVSVAKTITAREFDGPALGSLVTVLSRVA